MQHSPDRDGADLDVGAVFAAPAFATLKARGAAFAVVHPGTRTVVWANATASAHWAAPDADALASVLFGHDGRGGGWLDEIARGVAPGRAPRLARGGLARGFRMRARTALIRGFTAADGTVLLGFAVPDAMTGQADPDAWRRPAWPGESMSDPTPVEGEAVPAEPDPGLSLARRSQAAVLRDRLGRALDGAATLRLLWRTDAAGAVTQIDADAFARLGAPLRFDRGPLPEVVAPFDPAAAGRLRSALASRTTWSGIVVDLPVADAAARVPLALSGSPVFGPERIFAGFRGFGTLDLGRLELAPPHADVVMNRPLSAGDVAPVEAFAAEAPEPAAVEDVTPVQAFATGAPEPAAVEDMRPEAPPAANVVHLRAFQALISGRPGPAPALPATVEPAAARPSPPAPDDPVEPVADDAPLSDDLAFLALGEALRARIGAPRPVSPPHAPPPEAVPAEALLLQAAPSPVPDPPPEPVADATAGLVDQLPMPLIVTVGASPAFANAAVAARLGYPDAAALLRVGEDLVVSSPSEPEAATMVLRDARHGLVTVAGRRSAIAWGGAAATLWILGDAGDVDPPAVTAPAAEAPGADEGDGRAAELLDRVDDAVALLDGTGLVRRLNRRGEAWFGPDGALGQSFTELLAPESRPAALALLGEVRSQRDGLGAPPSHREVLARAGDSTPVAMVLTLGRLGTAGFYLTLRDVTALKRAETERARTERDHARDAGRLPGLLGKVSHEIRTPLNAILGFAEVMMDERFGPLGNPRYRDYLKDIHASGVQVMTLVEDLLDLSRIEAGQLDLVVAALDVNRIVAETVAQMQPEAHRERVIMRTSLGGRIPAVLADEHSARQIVRNLLSNAVKFNEPGGQVIVSTALGDDGAVLLRVRDTGVGMTDDEIAAALEPFGGVAPSHPANGNGLGLPLTRALVGANGATMAIRSRPREGTLVEIAFASASPDEARRPA